MALARWPVGGIRTYLRNLFTAAELADYRFVLIAPNEERLDAFVAQGHLGECRWLPTGCSMQEFVSVTRQAMREFPRSLIHSHGFQASTIAGLAGLARGAQHLLTVHDVILPGQFMGIAAQRVLAGVAFGLWCPHQIHCATLDSRENLLERFRWVPGLRRKITVIPHGVDVEHIRAAVPRDVRTELHCSAATRLFGFLGRFMAPKGFAVLVQAVGILRKRGLTPRHMRVLAVGSGGFIGEERRGIERLGLEDYFVFWPYQADVAPILKGIDCLLMPSLWEASGLLAMEAMVAGVPVIGSSCMGLRETLIGSPSREVAPNDPLQLAKAIAAFIEEPHTAAAAAFQARAMRNFRSDISYSKLAQLYEQLAT